MVHMVNLEDTIKRLEPYIEYPAERDENMLRFNINMALLVADIVLITRTLDKTEEDLNTLISGMFRNSRLIDRSKPN